MIEVIIAITLLSILALYAIPRLDRGYRQEAKDNLLSAIRYTQHLALTDNKTNPFDLIWQKRLWKIRFSTSNISNRAFFYTISSDINANGSISKNETALDPANGKYMYNNNADSTIHEDESQNIFIGKKYGITDMTFTGGCISQHIAFDQIGRPHNSIGTATNNYSKYMTSDCTITIKFSKKKITPLIITIEKETGYVSGD